MSFKPQIGTDRSLKCIIAHRIVIVNIYCSLLYDLDREAIVKAQKEDENFIEVRRWFTDVKPSHEKSKAYGEELKAYAQQEIKEEPDGMLVRHVITNKSPLFKRDAILVPETLRDAFYFGSHLGLVRYLTKLNAFSLV